MNYGKTTEQYSQTLFFKLLGLYELDCVNFDLNFWNSFCLWINFLVNFRNISFRKLLHVLVENLWCFSICDNNLLR